MHTGLHQDTGRAAGMGNVSEHWHVPDAQMAAFLPGSPYGLGYDQSFLSQCSLTSLLFL